MPSLDIDPKTSPLQKQLFNFKYGEKNGLIVQIKQTKKNQIRFTNVVFNRSGRVLVGSTNRGDIYNFDFIQNKFWLLTNTLSCSLLKFNAINDEELFIGKNTGTVDIIDVESGVLVSKLDSHRHPVRDVSFARNYLCITSSVDEAIVWDLRSFTMIQSLCLNSGTILKQVMFIPASDYVLTCFSDDSIHVWKYGSFEHANRIQPSLWNNFTVKCLAFTRNGRTLVLGGYSCRLAVFLVDNWSLVKMVVLPPPITAIRKLDFISQPYDGGSNRILSILAGNGIMYFYDMQQDVLLNNLSFDMEIGRFDSSVDGRFVALNTTDGKIYIQLLTSYICLEEEKEDKLVVVKEENKRRRSNAEKKAMADLNQIDLSMSELLEKEKLLSILKEYYQFPEMHRYKIWVKLLQLPNNVREFRILNNKCAEASFENIEKKYPIENRTLLKNLKLLLFTVYLWCPFFSEVSYLPLFIFPFVKVFQNNPLVCFEVTITIIMNWCQYWFEYYPLPPINILAMVENVFIQHEPNLLKHLLIYDITSKTYAWSLLQTGFSEVLLMNDWFILWDHILSNEPSFLIMVTVAFSLIQKQKLMNLTDPEDFEQFYQQPNLIDLKGLITKAYRLMEITESPYHPRKYFESFKKLDSKIYPIFTAYPKAALDYQKNSYSLRSAKVVSEKKESEILGRVESKSNRNEDAKRTIEEYVRMKEVNRIYEEKLVEDRTKLKEQTLKLSRLKNDLEKFKSDEDYLVHYEKFLETEFAVQKWCSKGDVKQMKKNEIYEKVLEAHRLAEEYEDGNQYLAELVVTKGLEVLDNSICLLQIEIRKCTSQNTNINQYFLDFMKNAIDSTEGRIEYILEKLDYVNIYY